MVSNESGGLPKGENGVAVAIPNALTERPRSIITIDSIHAMMYIYPLSIFRHCRDRPDSEAVSSGGTTCWNY